jgi:predicted kinase
MLDQVALFREYCLEQGCLDSPKHFASPHTRYLYFHTEGRQPDVEAYDDSTLDVTVMSGLPGSGKDTYIRQFLADWPVVSLDDMRVELGIHAGDDQGLVVQAAKRRARAYLRAGQRFVWNATNITERFRTPLLTLFASYRARIRIVYVEAPFELLWSQNRARANAVPESAILAMLDRWEVPNCTEAHEVVCELLPRIC